jgi:HAD superfamily hydrolase (TIGR01549 family)
LARLLAWSLAVNENVARVAKNIQPFKGVRASLDKIRAHADLIIVSQTPEDALVREWHEHGLEKYPVVIAGQELGTKADHLMLAAGKKYAAPRVLMIGDALGDLQAAETARALFFPINPGHEEASWQRLFDEAFDKFLAGTFAGDYQAGRVQEFRALLPEIPPWKK